MIKFPKIKISIGYIVTFESKNMPQRFIFGNSNTTIEDCKRRALRDMTILGQDLNEYTMSTKREINISITF
jgi:hypothetical protein